MDYQNLDIKIKKSWRMARSIFFAILLFSLGIFIVISLILDFFQEIKIPALIGFGILIVLGFFIIVLLPEIGYKRWKYLITEDKVEIQKGIVFLKTEVIPIVRVQHVAIERGPISRKFGLAEVVIYTASGNFKIIGLTEETVKEISEKLKDKVIKRLEGNNVWA